MKYIVSIFFIVIYLLGVFQTSWTLIDFYWKRDYYTQNFCVNLDAGITQCRASCFLEKKLASERDDSSNPEIALVKTSKSVELSFQEMYSNLADQKDKSETGFLEDSYNFEYSYKIFHPPKS